MNDKTPRFSDYNDSCSDLQKCMAVYCQARTPQEEERALQDIDHILATNEKTPDNLLKATLNNFTLLMDASRIPKRDCHDQRRGEKMRKITGMLLDFFAKAYDAGTLDKEKYAQYLALRTSRGFTALHDILIIGDEESFVKMRDQLRKVRDDGFLDPRTYAELYTLPIEHNFTPLHDVVRSGNDKTCAHVLEELKSLTDFAAVKHTESKKPLIADEYDRALTIPTDNGFTPIHEAVIGGNVGVYRLMADALMDFRTRRQDNKHARHTYKAQIIGREHGQDYSLLHDAIRKNHPEMMAEIIKSLQLMIEKGFMSTAEYGQLLTHKVGDVYSPLNDALATGNHKIYSQLVTELKSLRKRALPKELYMQQFIQSTPGNYKPIHNAIGSENPELFKAFINDLTNAIPEAVRSQVMQEQLLSEPKGQNLYQYATRPSPHTATPEILMGLHDLFHQWFGNGQQSNNPEADALIAKLCAMEMNAGTSPDYVDNQQPGIRSWLNLVLEPSSTTSQQAAKQL